MRPKEGIGELLCTETGIVSPLTKIENFFKLSMDSFKLLVESNAFGGGAGSGTSLVLVAFVFDEFGLLLTITSKVLMSFGLELKPAGVR